MSTAPHDAPAPAPAPARGEWPKAVPLLVLAALLAYSNSFTKAFVFDDIHFIVANPDLVGDARKYVGDSFGARPVIKASVLVNYRLGGFAPPGYHALNFLVHLGAGLTLFGLVRRTLLLPRFGGRYDDAAPGLAFAVALLWLVHPLQTQAVTYIVQRCESMMGLFYLLTLYCWLRGATGPGRGHGWYGLAVCAFALCCGSKEVSVTLPPVLVAFDRIFLARSWRELVRERGLAYVGVLGVWVAVLRPALRGATGDAAGAGVGFEIATATPWTYLLTESEVILHYLRLAVWPVRQAFDYIDWPIARSIRDVWPALLAVSLLAAVSFALLYVRPAAGFVGFWFFVILAPTSSVMPIIDPAFEHRMYLPLAAVAVGLVLAGHGLLGRLNWPEPRRAAAGLGVAALAAAALIPLTFARNETYRTPLACFEAAAAARPNNPRPLGTLALHALAAGDLDRAGDAVRRAGACVSDPILVEQYRANWLAQSGRLDEAAVAYRDYINKSPFVAFQSQSPELYRRLVWVRLATGRADLAVITAKLLLSKQSDAALNWYSLAAAELGAGHAAEAREAARKAAELDPGVAARSAEEARSLILAPGGPAAALNRTRALGLVEVACLIESDPGPRTLDTLALAYAAHGRFADAAAAARRGVAAARARGQEDWERALTARLALYEANRPYGYGPPNPGGTK